MLRRLALLAAAGVAACSPATSPEGGDKEAIRALVEAQGEARLAGGVIVERFGFSDSGGAVEAVVTRPGGEGARPGIVMVPGHLRTAWDLLPVAVRLAREGFATVAVSQPGFGGSAGPADFAGPRTYRALLAAAERFAAEPYVDPARIGVYGYSRGGLAAAQLAARTDLFRAAAFGGGIYDFETALSQVGFGIAASMRLEAGTSAEAARFRSPIHDMAGLDGPALIFHGAEDQSAPPDQARALARRLAELGRPQELALIPGRGHALGLEQVVAQLVPFFRRHLAAGGGAGE